MSALWKSLAALALAVTLLLPLQAAADETYTPGFQTLGLWEAEQNLRLDVAVWYPARRAPRTLRYGDWEFRAARRASPAAGRYPLILLSHDSGGSRFSLHLLASELAQSGFVVAAPTHRMDNMNLIADPFSLPQLRDRIKELRALPDVLAKTAPFADIIDFERIGVVGIGPGGTAALLLAGGQLDSAGWEHYCFRAGPRDVYCSAWVAPRMDAMAKAIARDERWHDPRIDAVAVVAPAYGMLFSPRSLQRVHIPVLLLRADLDQINRAPNHADAIFKALPQTPDYAILQHTDNASLLSPCTPELADLVPDMCTPLPEANQEDAQRQLADHTIRFMTAHLGAALPPSEGVRP